MCKKGYDIAGRNVFKDIGVPNAEEHLVETQCVYQPDISKMVRREFRQFSVERLLRFLVKLDQDVEIAVHPRRDRQNAATLHIS